MSNNFPYKNHILWVSIKIVSSRDSNRDKNHIILNIYNGKCPKSITYVSARTWLSHNFIMLRKTGKT